MCEEKGAGDVSGGVIQRGRSWEAGMQGTYAVARGGTLCNRGFAEPTKFVPYYSALIFTETPQPSWQTPLSFEHPTPLGDTPNPFQQRWVLAQQQIGHSQEPLVESLHR